MAPDGKKRIGLKTIFTVIDVGAKTENEVPLPETNKETEWVHVQTLTKDQTKRFMIALIYPIPLACIRKEEINTNKGNTFYSLSRDVF